jgi:shikimate dehydrogenase
VDKGKALIRLAIFGRPVEHSLSPVIHQKFAEQSGLEVDYRRIDSGPEEFPEALENFRLSGGIGCNITMPLKQEAWRLAAQASPEVGLAQAANTLVYDPATGWFAHNTDGAGLFTDLVENHGIEIRKRRILILGAGGATAGILAPLLAAGPAEIMLVNRNLERARLLGGRFGAAGKVTVSGWDDLSRQGVFDLLINATSLGHGGQAPPLAAASFAPGGLCYDLNYFKASLPLKRHCEEIGRPYINGLGMLVEQAAKSFAIWTGIQPQTAAVTETLRRSAGA